jgi:hypothetical protein
MAGDCRSPGAVTDRSPPRNLAPIGNEAMTHGGVGPYSYPARVPAYSSRRRALRSITGPDTLATILKIIRLAWRQFGATRSLNTLP